MQLNCDLLSKETRENLELLQWMSERNEHIPVSDLAFLLDMPQAEQAGSNMMVDYMYEA